MLHTGMTERELRSDYIYMQNGLDVSVYYLHNIQLPHSTRFYRVERINKKTGERKWL